MTQEGTLRGAAAGLALGAMALAGAAPAEAQVVCGSRDQIQKILTERYKEVSRGLGLVSDSGLVELYTSESGTFSILMTMAGGSTCIIAAGHTWQDVIETASGPSA